MPHFSCKSQKTVLIFSVCTFSRSLLSIQSASYTCKFLSQSHKIQRWDHITSKLIKSGDKSVYRFKKQNVLKLALWKIYATNFPFLIMRIATIIISWWVFLFFFFVLFFLFLWTLFIRDPVGTCRCCLRFWNYIKVDPITCICTWHREKWR